MDKVMVKFRSYEDQNTFVKRIRDERKDMANTLEFNPLRPTVTVSTPTAADKGWVADTVEGRGRVFDDVQFQPMPM